MLVSISSEIYEYYKIHKKLNDMFYGKNKNTSESGMVHFNKWQIEYCSPAIANAINQLFIMRVNDFYTAKKSPLIIDCGANIGMSVFNYKTKYPDAKIIAFEADPVFFEVFKRNMKRNNISNTQVYNTAVWVADGTIDWYSERHDGSKIVEKSALNNYSKTTTVKSCDIASFMNEEVDLLKLDIEGAEYAVVSHLAKQKKLENLQNIIIECHLHQEDFIKFASIIQDLKNAGFKIAINNMGNWRDLIRRPRELEDHYEQYLLILGWRDNEYLSVPEESIALPILGKELLDIAEAADLLKITN